MTFATRFEVERIVRYAQLELYLMLNYYYYYFLLFQTCTNKHYKIVTTNESIKMFDWRGNESQRLQTKQNEAAKQAPSDRSCHGRRSLNDVLTCRLKAARGVIDLEMSEVWKRPKNESLASFTPRTVSNYARPRRLTMQWRKYFTGLAFSFVFVVTCFTNKVGVGAEKCLTSCWWKLRELATLLQVNEAGEVALVAERNVVTSITVHVWVWHHLIIDFNGRISCFYFERNVLVLVVNLHNDLFS